MTRLTRAGMTVVLVLSSAASLWPQGKDSNYNDFYRFPLSIGLEYQSLTPLQSYDADYTVFDVAFDFRYPIPALTVLQPFLRAGIMKFDSADPLFPDKWDHTHWYGAVGMAYTNRFVRNFELGGELQAGFSEAVFPRCRGFRAGGLAQSAVRRGGKDQPGSFVRFQHRHPAGPEIPAVADSPG